LRERERRSAKVLKLDDAVAAVVAALKERCMTSPYLKGVCRRAPEPDPFFEVHGIRLRLYAIETFAAYRADQAFDEWMRERRVRQRLASHVKDAQVRLPSVEPVQSIVVRAEVCR